MYSQTIHHCHGKHHFHLEFGNVLHQNYSSIYPLNFGNINGEYQCLTREISIIPNYNEFEQYKEENWIILFVRPIASMDRCCCNSLFMNRLWWIFLRIWLFVFYRLILLLMRGRISISTKSKILWRVVPLSIELLDPFWWRHWKWKQRDYHQRHTILIVSGGWSCELFPWSI